MPNDLYQFVSIVLGAIPKEAYLLIGTVLGAFVTLITGIINTRGQLKVARPNHEHLYHLETQKLEYQQQAEAQKLAYQERKERIAWLQERLEEAEQILLRIDMLNSLTGSDIARMTGISEAEWSASYLKLDEEAPKLHTMAELYFPELRRPISEPRGRMNVFWGEQRHLLYVETDAFVTDHLEDIEKDPSFQDEARGRAWVDIQRVGAEVPPGSCLTRPPRQPNLHRCLAHAHRHYGLCKCLEA
jgi:hypothetical protein